MIISNELETKVHVPVEINGACCQTLYCVQLWKCIVPPRQRSLKKRTYCVKKLN